MRHLAALALVLAAGCGHQDPFSYRQQPLPGPFGGGNPLRLTFNIGYDIWAAWSADGSEIWYSAQDSFAFEQDHCLVSLPAGGGSGVRRQCPSPSNNLTELLQQPAPNGTEVAYAISELGAGREHAPFRFSIWLADERAGSIPRLVQPFPYYVPSGKSHDAPIYLQWLRPGVLLYLGAENGCCNKDTLRFGEQVVTLDLTGPAPVRTLVPNTTRASAVSAARDGLSIYYTFYGDSRVYQQVLATGQVSVLYDFGGGRIVRDPDVAGDRLVAIVDGIPNYRFVPAFGLVQVDYGGRLTIVDLAAANETLYPSLTHLFKRPRLSADGRRVVVEAYPMTITDILDGNGNVIARDTMVGKWDDLWLVEE